MDTPSVPPGLERVLDIRTRVTPGRLRSCLPRNQPRQAPTPIPPLRHGHSPPRNRRAHFHATRSRPFSSRTARPRRAGWRHVPVNAVRVLDRPPLRIHHIGQRTRGRQRWRNEEVYAPADALVDRLADVNMEGNPPAYEEVEGQGAMDVDEDKRRDEPDGPKQATLMDFPLRSAHFQVQPLSLVSSRAWLFCLMFCRSIATVVI